MHTHLEVKAACLCVKVPVAPHLVPPSTKDVEVVAPEQRTASETKTAGTDSAMDTE
jgi:hypothetical protein